MMTTSAVGQRSWGQTGLSVPLIDQQLAQATLKPTEYPNIGLIYHMQSQFAYGVPEEVKWQVLFAAKAHIDLHGTIQLGGFFSPDVLTSCDHLALLYRILASYYAYEKTQYEGKFAMSHKHLEKIEDRLKDMMGKGNDVLGALRNQADPSLALLSKRLERSDRVIGDANAPYYAVRIPLAQIDRLEADPVMEHVFKKIPNEDQSWAEVYSLALVLAHTRFGDDVVRVLNTESKVKELTENSRNMKDLDAEIRTAQKTQSLMEKMKPFLEEFVHELERNQLEDNRETEEEITLIEKSQFIDVTLGIFRLSIDDLRKDTHSKYSESDDRLAKLKEDLNNWGRRIQILEEKKSDSITDKRKEIEDIKKFLGTLVKVLRGEGNDRLSYKDLAGSLSILPAYLETPIQGYKPYSAEEEVAVDANLSKLKDALNDPQWRVIQMIEKTENGNKLILNTFIRNQNGTCDRMDWQGNWTLGLPANDIFVWGEHIKWDQTSGLVFYPPPPRADQAHIY